MKNRFIWSLAFVIISSQAQGEKPQSVINVQMSVTFDLTGGNITGYGFTNLPDGTQLAVFGTGQFPRCFPACGFSDQATVQHGVFAFDLKKHNPGFYLVEITTPGANVEPQSVQSIIGKHGELMRGDLVVDFNHLLHFTDDFSTAPRVPRKLVPTGMLGDFDWFIDYGHIVAVH